MPTTTCTVAFYPPGNSHNRILIPEVELGPDGSLEHAKAYAQDAITALAALPQSQWRMHVVQSNDVQDANPITKNQRTDT